MSLRAGQSSNNNHWSGIHHYQAHARAQSPKTRTAAAEQWDNRLSSQPELTDYSTVRVPEAPRKIEDEQRRWQYESSAMAHGCPTVHRSLVGRRRRGGAESPRTTKYALDKWTYISGALTSKPNSLDIPWLMLVSLEKLTLSLLFRIKGSPA